MLTCDICGEEVLLEEDMKTHLLLSHLENELHCPLCSLSGVSYEELCFHISNAHPERQQTAQGAAHLISPPGSSTATNTGGTEREKPQTSQSCLARDSWDEVGDVSHTGATGVTTVLIQPKQNKTLESGDSSSGKTASTKLRLTTGSPETRQASVRHFNEDSNGPKSQQHNKAKQKRLSLTRREELFTCPMCELVCSSSVILHEHVELHLQEQSSAEAGSPGSDLALARQLQQEEEEQRRRQEEAQEEKEFKKLQRQFGLDGRGGYRRQLESTMERAVAKGLMAPSEFHCKRAEMMESLASGVDDGRTRTQGVVRALHEYYQTESRDCVHVWLSADTDHYCSSAGDKGWGCGYRNFQMLISSLQCIDVYSSFLQDKDVPSIPRVQSMIEEAWKEGLDPQGASHFNQRLQGTRAWIGATEMYSLLTSLGISARIIDFHQPTGPGSTHPRLFEWVKQYYCQSSKSSRLTPRLIQTALPPLYLQHQGHSHSIVGLEQKKNGSLCLLVLDPGSSVSDTRKLLSRDTISTAVRHVRKFPGSLKHKQYQVVAAHGILSAEEKQISILNSRTLCAERIP
ncbi:zinc finger-containing ubiquitin peptidase 1 isoform X5 [Hippoglossus hippoglossus]|uniref:zinc finger-containing ubiquitin peptidase 1 isoform X5 n=1 Tax=Hippoglossus hippoglossus TaxID=8267 RepID=UPI00148CAFAF|nr:zinc finger-containing ubiquitin peptidase 1 isoform X5 [Hippoglossus hippoglossus]